MAVGCWIGGEKIGKRWGGVGGGGREDDVVERFKTLTWRFSFCFFRSSRWRIEVAKAVIKGGEFVLFAWGRSIYIWFLIFFFQRHRYSMEGKKKIHLFSKGLKKSTCYTEAKGGISRNENKREKKAQSQQEASISTKPRHPSVVPSSSPPDAYYTAHSMAHQQSQY